MSIQLSRRGAAALAVALAAQGLAGCVIVPHPYYRPRAAAVEREPGYPGGWREHRDYRDERRYRPDADGR